MSDFYSGYRHTTIGKALDETLRDLAESGELTMEVAAELMNHFDRVVNQTFASRIKSKATIKVAPLHLPFNSRRARSPSTDSAMMCGTGPFRTRTFASRTRSRGFRCSASSRT